MKSSSILLIVMLFLAASVEAQQNFLQTVLIELPNKTSVLFEPSVSSPDSTLITSNFQNLRQTASPAANNRVTRFLGDAANNVVFGYELTVETISPKQFRLTIDPLAANAQLPRTFVSKSLSLAGKLQATTLLTLPNITLTQAINDGEALNLDLLVHPQLNIKIADKIRVATNREKFAPPPSIPRDFTLNDLEIAVANLKLKVNGEQLSFSKFNKSYSGSLLWLYLPPKGFFLVSLVPREGYDFRKIGVVRGNEISFELKGDRYTLASDNPILPEDGAWFVWVLHDPNHKPFLIEAPIDFQQTAKRKSDWQLKNPFALNGSIVKKDEKASFGVKQKEQSNSDQKEFTAPPPLFLPNVRVGAVKEIENIFPKN